MLLNHGDQKLVGQLVSMLPEDVPSMAWRSALSEKIYAEHASFQKRRRFLWLTRPAAGILVAGALALIVLVRVPTKQPSFAAGKSIESAVIDTYQQETAIHEIASAGPIPGAESAHIAAVDPDSDWPQLDSETL